MEATPLINNNDHTDANLNNYSQLQLTKTQMIFYSYRLQERKDLKNQSKLYGLLLFETF